MDPFFTVEKWSREEFLNRVDIGTRFRQEYELDDDGNTAKDDSGKGLTIVNLAKSMNEVGVIQSIAVLSQKAVAASEGLWNTYSEHNADGSPAKQELLIAGGRRYAAIAHPDCTVKFIPVKVYKEKIGEGTFRKIELVENLHRKQLNWPERVALESALHNMLVDEKGEWSQINPEGHSITDTAKELGKSKSAISRSLGLAKAIKKNPELAKLKSENEVIKLLQKEFKDRKLKKQQAAVEQRRASTPEDKQKKNLIRAYNVVPIAANAPLLEAGFFEWVKEVPSESVNAVECDPPYGINLTKIKKKRDDRTSLLDYNEISDEDYPPFIRRVIQESYRIMKPNAWFFLWFATKWWGTIERAIMVAGKPPGIDFASWLKDPRRLRCNFLPISWYKGSSGQNHQPNYNLSHCYDLCFYAYKGKPGIVQPRGDYFNCLPITPSKKIHDTERPMQLYVEMFRSFLSPGSSMCVNFLGSGKAILAASNCGITAFGCDGSDVYKARYVDMVVKGTPGNYTD